MTTTTMTNQERITAALAAIGFDIQNNNDIGRTMFHDGAGVIAYVPHDWEQPVSIEINDPNWPAIPAVMTQVAEIVSPTLAINTVKEAASE